MSRPLSFLLASFQYGAGPSRSSRIVPPVESTQDPLFGVIEALQPWWTSGSLGEAAVATASVLFILFTVSTLACLPASGLLVLIGAVVGVGPGALVAFLGTLTSATLCRLLARGALGRALQAFIERRPRLRLVQRAVQDGGWRLVFLIRLSPASPLGLTNWVFAFVGIPLGRYLAATAIATLPAKVMWLNVGASGRESLDLFQHPEAATPGQWALLIVGTAATIGSVVLLARLTRRRLQNELTKVAA